MLVPWTAGRREGRSLLGCVEDWSGWRWRGIVEGEITTRMPGAGWF